MQMSYGDIVDRYTILRLKIQRSEDPQPFLREFSAIFRAVHCKEWTTMLKIYAKNLYDTNEAIWNLEAAIRQGKEKQLGLKEVGRRALKIREWNAKRIEAKNAINEITKSGFREKKINHASETR